MAAVAVSSHPVGFASTPFEATLTSTPVKPTITPSKESLVIGGGISAIAPLPAEATEGLKSPQPVIPTQFPSNGNINMHPATTGVAPCPKHKNDDNLPPWLALMIQYLCGVSEDAAWQDLVTEFVNFKKHHPPNGVSLNISFVVSLTLTILLYTEPSYEFQT